MKKSHLAFSICSALIVSSILFVSCKKEKSGTQETLDQQPVITDSPASYAEKHSVDGSMAILGRVLFYDKNLSTNNAVACGSCHKQEFAFADNVQFNKGFNGVNLKRNSPSIQGVRGFLNKSEFIQSHNGMSLTAVQAAPNKDNQAQVLLFWDGRQNSVADMVLNPVLNHNEMNMPDFESLVKKLNSITYYPSLFTQAFGDASITKERIAYSLESFLACLNADPNSTPTGLNTSSNSSQLSGFDNNGNFTSNSTFNTSMEPDPRLTPLEEQGRQLFHTKYNCARCHDPSNSGDYGSVTSPSQMFNIGLDEEYTDNGLGALTKKQGDNGLFKVPTLKNISLTAPYMHDGRFKNLGDVLDHYSHNIKPNKNLSGFFVGADGAPKKLNILPTEKSAIIAFLNTLKDEDFLTSSMYSDPFKK